MQSKNSLHAQRSGSDIRPTGSNGRNESSSRLSNMLEGLPVMACTRRARQLARAESLTREREAGWQGSIPRCERGIPAYDPRKDPHCRILLDSQGDAGRQSEIIALESSVMHRDGVVEHSGFAAVAAILDFKHHEGMDPGAEIAVLKAILRRETLLSQIEAAAEKLVRRAQQNRALQCVQCPDTQLMDKVQKRALVDLMTRLREATVDVCEAIAKWRTGSNGARITCEESSSGHYMKPNIRQLPRPFLWQGSNYLLKVAKSDLDFVGAVAPFAFALGVQPSKMCRNPLMLPRTLDEAAADLFAEIEENSMMSNRHFDALLQAVDGGFELNHNTGNNLRACDKMQAAEMMLVTEEQLEKEREHLLRHPVYKSLPSESKGRSRSSPADKNDAAPPVLHSSANAFQPAYDSFRLPIENPLESVNPGWVPRNRGLIAWYDDAQTQLRRLKESRPGFGDCASDRRRATSAGSGKNVLRPLRFQVTDRRRSRASSANASPYNVNSRNATVLYKNGKHVKNITLSHQSKRKDTIEPQLAATSATPWRTRRTDAPQSSSKMKSSSQIRGVIGSDDRINDAGATPVVALKKRKKTLQSENASSDKLLALTTAASQHATEARASAMMALADITSSVLTRLSKIETPPESLARLGASVKTLATPGEAVPTDLRWPTILSTIRTNPEKLIKAINAVDPGSIAGFKRRALHRFLSFNNARNNSVRLRTLASDAADSAHRLDAWVRAVLAASEACLAAAEAARAVDVTKASIACSDAALGAATAAAAVRRGKARHKKRSVSKAYTDARRSAHADLLSTTIRNDVDFDHSKSTKPSPWLVSVFKLQTDGYEVKVYHVVTSYETSLLVTEADASVAATMSGFRNVEKWAREILPFRLKLSRYGDSVTLCLSEFVPSFCRKLRQQPLNDSLANACQLSFERFLAIITQRGNDFASISEYLPSELVAYLTSKEFERQCSDQYDSAHIDKSTYLTLAKLSAVLLEIAVKHNIASCISLGDCTKVIALFDCHEKNMTQGEFIELCRFLLAAGKLRMLEMDSVHNALKLLANCERDIQTVVKVLPRKYKCYLDSEEFERQCDLRFQMLDVDRSNTLSNNEVCPIIMELASLRDDTCILPEYTAHVMKLFDTDLNGSIDRQEFLRFAKCIFAITFLGHLKNCIEIVIPRPEINFRCRNDVTRAAAQRESLDYVVASVEAKNAHMAKVMSKLPLELVDFLQSVEFKVACADQFNASNANKPHSLCTSDVLALVIDLASLHGAFCIKKEECARLIQFFTDTQYVVSVDAFISVAQFVLATTYISGKEDKRIASIVATSNLGKDHVQEILKWIPAEMLEFLESSELREFGTKRYDQLCHLDTVEGHAKHRDSIHPHIMLPIISELAGVQCSEDECVQIALAFDDDDDGFISLEEFISFMIFLIAFTYMSELMDNLDIILRNGSNGTFKSEDAEFELPSFARSKCSTVNSDDVPANMNVQTFLRMRRLLSSGPENLSEVLAILPESVAQAITSDELVSGCMLRYDEVDVDNNGRLSPLEVWPVVLELANDKTEVQLSEADRDEVLKDLFAKFDVNGNESIDRTEFVAFVQFVLICRYIDTMLENMQPDETGLRNTSHGHITFDMDDACRVYDDLARLKQSKHAREILASLDDHFAREILNESFDKKCLEQFDALHTGARECVSARELVPIIANLANIHSDLVISGKKCAELINIYDSEGKGQFNRNEFVSLSQFVLACAYLDERSRKISLDKFRVEVIMNVLERGKSHFDEVLTKLPAHHAGYLLSHKFQDECLRNFDELDKNGDGFLSKSELYPVIKCVVEMWDVIDDAMTHDQYERFFHLFQGENSSSEIISREEFVRLSQFVLVMALILKKQKQGHSGATNTDVEHTDAEHALIEEACIDDMLALLGNGRANMRQVITRLPEDLADFVTSQKFVSEAIRRYEEELDRNGDGILSPSELAPVVSELAGVHEVAVTPEHSEKMVQLFDLDASGTIDRSEYVEATQFIFIFAYLENQRERHRKRRASEESIKAIHEDESLIPTDCASAVLDDGIVVNGHGPEVAAAAANIAAGEVGLGTEYKGTNGPMASNSESKNRAALVIQTHTRRRRALRQVGRLRRQSASRNLAATKIQSQVRRRQVADPVISRPVHGDYDDDFVDELNEIDGEDDALTFLLEDDDDDESEDGNFPDAQHGEYADYDEDFDPESPQS